MAFRGALCGLPLLHTPWHAGLQVSFFWLKRVRDLTPAVTQLLGVRSVWCDTKTEHNSQKFVIWAGYLLEKKWVAAWG